jgi:hypothetical protein
MKKLNLGSTISSVGGMMSFVLGLLVFFIMCGCGSESQQSPPQVGEKAKPVIDQKKASPTVTEIPQGKEPLTGKKVKEEGKTTRLPATQLLDEEILPPSAPGEKGITRRDLEKMKAQEPTINPLDEEVLPPGNPGEKGITRRDMENFQKQPQTAMDPMDEEVLPGLGGEKGITRREIEQFKATNPYTPPSGPGELIPFKPKTQAGGKTK